MMEREKQSDTALLETSDWQGVKNLYFTCQIILQRPRIVKVLSARINSESFLKFLWETSIETTVT